ncbi:MAG: ATP-binding cassette domain-containing protein [Mesorhizobium sp.]
MHVPLSCSATGIVYDVPLASGRSRIVDVPALELAPGQLTALAGPSGSGKSSLLYLLAGLLAPSRGQIVWGGRVLSVEPEAKRDRWRLENAGFVFQSFHLIEELSPLDNVLATAWFRGGAASKRERARELLARFGVPEGARRTNLLSNGEQQRVALARALLFDPPVIFADEPTASLDAASGTLVSQTLRDLAAISGKTVIVASHDPILLSAAHRIVRLDHGRLADARASEVAA